MNGSQGGMPTHLIPKQDLIGIFATSDLEVTAISSRYQRRALDSHLKMKWSKGIGPGKASKPSKDTLQLKLNRIDD
jgi:hypothetical protein